MFKVTAAHPADQLLGEACEALQALYIRQVFRLEPVIQEPYIHAPVAAAPAQFNYHNMQKSCCSKLFRKKQTHPTNDCKTIL